VGFGLLVPASAAFALVLHAVRAAEVPSREDWARAERAVREAYRPGDLVAFAPGWAQEGRGRFQGLDVIPQEVWSEDDVARAGRLFVVATFGVQPPDWLGEAAQVEAHTNLGRIAVTRLKMRGGRPLTDFADRVLAAAVRLQLPGRTLTCERRGDRHDCTEGRFPWRWVGRHQMVIGGRARSCIYAHPTTGAPLEIAFAAAPLGRTLVIAHGLSDAVADRGAPVAVEVRVDGQRVGDLQHSPARGWRRTRIGTSRFAGRAALLQLVVTTPDDGARHFCLTAEAVE
jgi:hypothetical protein